MAKVQLMLFTIGPYIYSSFVIADASFLFCIHVQCFSLLVNHINFTGGRGCGSDTDGGNGPGRLDAAPKNATETLIGGFANNVLFSSLIFGADHLEESRSLRLHYTYLHELQQAPAIQLKLHRQEEPFQGQIRSWDAQIDVLSNWPPSETWTFQFHPESIPLLNDYLWGTQYGMELLEWLQLVTWPTQQLDPLGAGVSWYELTLSYMLAANKGILVNEASGLGFRPKRLRKNDPDVSFGKQILFFERAISSLKILLGQDLWCGTRAQATSVRILGATQTKCGLT